MNKGETKRRRKNKLYEGKTQARQDVMTGEDGVTSTELKVIVMVIVLLSW